MNATHPVPLFQAVPATNTGGDDAGLLLAAEVHEGNRHERRYGYRICGTGFLVPRGIHSEIVSNPVLHLLPWVTPCLRGMLNQRGHVVPVFDLAPVFDHERMDGACAYVLIIDRGERAVGVTIDALPAAVTCEPDTDPDLSTLPALMAQAVQATCKAAGQRWYEIDHLALFRAIAQTVLD